MTNANTPRRRSAALARVVDALERFGIRHRRSGTGFIACCPSHDDGSPSLSIRQGDKGVTLRCFAGCDKDAIVAALGMTWPELFDDYGDDRGARCPPNGARVRRFTVKADAPPPPPAKWLDIATVAYQQATIERPHLLYELADQLGVDHEALRDIRVGWLDADQIARVTSSEAQRRHARGAYAIPERDGQRRVVGLALRHHDGSKAFVAGGRRGLIVPVSFQPSRAATIWIVEGASDTAAILSDGGMALGRPSCELGRDDIRYFTELLRDLSETARLLVVAERDFKGRTAWPPADHATRERCERLHQRRRDVLHLPDDQHELGDLEFPGRDSAIATALALRNSLGRAVGWTFAPGDFKDYRAARQAKLASAVETAR